LKTRSILFVTLLSTLVFASIMLGQSQSQQPNPVDPTAQSPASPGPPPQSTPPTFPSGQAAPDSRNSQTSASGSDSQGARTFLGTIVRSKDGFSLRAGDVEYKLDDKSKAKQYVGRDVKVLGSLDRQNNTIHVQSIENQPTM
jgi:Protein of unknown function (DUF5818)